MPTGKRPLKIREDINITKDGFTLLDRKQFLIWLEDNPVTREVHWIQMHHTWKPRYENFTGDNHFQACRGMRNYHMKKKKDGGREFSDIAQNITTFPDGTLMICRSLNVIPAGIRGKNRYGICIEHYGNFDLGGDEMSLEHKKTVEFLNAALCIHKVLVPSLETIIYHTWFASKSCPGTNFYGGNTTEDCYRNLIPKIKERVELLLNVM